MIGAANFLDPVRERGFQLFTGVPCSYLQGFINYVIDSPSLRYVGASNEGDAVAIAAGAAVGGRGAVCMFQNSGLGNAVSAADGFGILAMASVGPILAVLLTGQWVAYRVRRRHAQAAAAQSEPGADPGVIGAIQ